MKKLIYLLILLPFWMNAQIVNIPDPNFKAKLLSATNTNSIAGTNSSSSAKIDTNDDGEIQVTEAVIIVSLNINNSNISNLSGIEAFVNLTNLSFRNNLVTNIDFINNLINLDYLDAAQNQIQAVHFTTSGGFIYFDVSNNLISSVTSTNIIFIGESLMSNNLIADLDLSKIKLSGGLHTYYNNPLISVNLKNNYIEDLNVLAGMNNPTLQFVCADVDQVVEVAQFLIDLAMPNVVVNSYCSFVPGGTYNTITGTTTFDANSNGCDANDAPQPNIRIDINDGINQGATFTNNTANYNFYTQSGIFTLTPNVENPSWFTFSPNSATIPFADSNNNVVTQNFCIVANGVHPDVEIVIAPITPARPGFDAVYQIVFKNKGNQTLSGNITFTYNDEVSDFVTAIPLIDTQSFGLLNWNYQSLQPFENRSIYVTLNINSPQESIPVNIDDILNFQATITPVIGDDMAEDNLFSYNQTVVGSYDPNDITCIEGEVVPPSEIGEYLHYIINFENTGTAEAENIVVKVEVDPTKFDIDSLQMLNTSHNAYIRQAGNKIEFIFQEVWLDTGGHGNVLLKIRSKNSLSEGDTVAKQANIYFDYNAPIETNMANTTFEILSTGNFAIDESITIFPNPTASIININCNNTIKTVELYDVQGRLLQTQIVDNATTSLDISNKTRGIYFAKITSENGVKVEKISKE